MNWQNTKEYELHVMNQDKLKWLHVWFAVLLFFILFHFWDDGKESKTE